MRKPKTWAPKTKSKFEARVLTSLDLRGVEYIYEGLKLDYTITGKYIPDLVLKNGVIIELKGYFDAQARRKMAAVKRAHPTLDIRFVFQNPNVKCGKKMTYAGWCDKYGYPYAAHTVPEEWTK